MIVGDEGKRYDRFRDRVMFPIRERRGAVIGFGGRVLGEGEPKYLNSPETPLFEKGRELYGLSQARDAIRDAGRVLVVEGYMDVVALAQAGVGYAVATLGTATTPAHVNKLLRLADDLVFSFDGDAAGRKAAWRALEVSLPLRSDGKPIRFLFLPEGEDPDSFIRKNGKEASSALRPPPKCCPNSCWGSCARKRTFAPPKDDHCFSRPQGPTCEKVTAPALKLQIVKEVARLGGVTQEEGEQAPPGADSAQVQVACPGKADFPPPSSAEWKLLSRVAAYPGLAEQSSIWPASIEPSRVSAPEEISAHFKRNRDGEKLSNAMMIESSRNRRGRAALAAQAFGLELRESEEDSRHFVRHTVRKLEIAQRRRK